jgi:hypothetical protein
VGHDQQAPPAWLGQDPGEDGQHAVPQRAERLAAEEARLARHPDAERPEE